ncbi:transposable element Tcb2 transposase [Trichonephila clavipes]|nr:transposable element Tcb2 transposase [Trichonephila clavipes]
MGFGSRRPTRIALLDSRHQVARLARVRPPTSLNAIRYVELLDDHLHPFMLFCYPYEAQKNPIGHLREQGVKGHQTAPTNLIELWTALANIWQIIPVKRFQKLAESISRHVAAVIKAREGPTRN